MNIKKLLSLDSKKDNVILTHFPYYWAPSDAIRGNQSQKTQVIFLGNDMSGFMDALDNNSEIIKQYVAKVDQCLDYIRREFQGSELFYKPHPSDLKEQKYLNLSSFKIINEKSNAEIFFWKNRDYIKAVFAVNSLGLLSAYGFGINAYAFSEFFRPIFGKKLFESIDDCYAGLPEYFFIRSFDQNLIPYSAILKNDPVLEKYFKNLLFENRGKVWFIVSATEFIVILISLAKFIKNSDPDRQINLVVTRHHRWDLININDIKPYFNDIIFLPRIHYSLKPGKILNALKTLLKIKNIGINCNDILISGSQVEFVENCFVSSYKKNKRIGLVLKRDFYANYDLQNSVFSKNDKFKFNKASLFFNKIFEPVLGLNKTLNLAYSPGCTTVTRYQKPINRVFDQVIILDIPK